jgi:hypothetical protein
VGFDEFFGEEGADSGDYGFYGYFAGKFQEAGAPYSGVWERYISMTHVIVL